MGAGSEVTGTPVRMPGEVEMHNLSSHFSWGRGRQQVHSDWDDCQSRPRRENIALDLNSDFKSPN